MLLGSQRRGLRSINMPKAAAVTAILLGLAPLVARADMETALKVEGWCKPVADGNYSAQTPHVDLCWGAFAALQGLSVIGLPDGHTRALGICDPPGSTRLQLIKIFVKYVNDHPETAHELFAIIAQRSLAKAFPCAE